MIKSNTDDIIYRIIPNVNMHFEETPGYFCEISESVFAFNAVCKVFIRQKVKKGYQIFPN